MSRRPALALLVSVVALIGCGGTDAPPAPDASVLLVSVDSLRVDRLQLWNEDDGVPTPHLEALSARGIRFANAWATSPWTAPSMVSAFTGLHPPSHGVAVRDDTTPRALPTLPRLLAAEGYELGNFSFFSEISYFRNLGLPPPPDGLRHTRLPDAFRSWLAEVDRGRPFFAWLHLLEPHLPYGASGYRATEVAVPGSTGLEEAQTRAAVPVGSVEFEPGDRRRLLRLYDADVARFDRALGRVLGALDETGRRENTIVVLVGDHGEELLEYGWIGHASTAKEAKLAPEVLRVPLVLAGPGVPSGEIDRSVVQHVDILPTVTALLGLARPTPVDGEDLLERRWFPRGTEPAFFDSSVGGNLTPDDRRDERVQGVTDGECLVSEHTVPGRAPEVRSIAVDGGRAGCSRATRRRLRDELTRWRRRQGTQRVALLEGTGDGPAPMDGIDVSGFEPSVRILRPRPTTTLSWRRSGGQVVLEWEAEPGSGGSYWIEYEVGRGVRHTEGSFEIEQSRVAFGPFPEGFWNDLAAYNPFRFRIVDPDGERRSSWRRFEVAATNAP